MAHSESFFVPTRELWWNDDFLSLMADRWQLQRVRTALDVGSGLGHWTRCLTRILPKDCQITGVDAEKRWVEKARESSRGNARLSFQVAQAENLPFDDATFDFVTCQTLLIHVPDVEAVLKEMLRVLKPGGLVGVVEPNNCMNVLSRGSSLRTTTTDELLKVARLQLECERGKRALGEGWNSVGEELPLYFAKQNLADIRVYVRDRANPLWPPYETEGQRLWIEQFLLEAERGTWAWGYEQSRRYFLAAGNESDDFENLWAAAVRQNRAVAAELKAGRWVGGLGSVNYLASGRKPASLR